VTLNPPTPAGGIEVSGPDDYVGLFQQAWNVVKDNYVRGDFNGTDWDAVYETYLPWFQAVDNQPDHFSLMSQLIRELRDEHSRFVPPENFGREFGLNSVIPRRQADQAETGLDIWPAREDQFLYVWFVCENSPAAEAGIRRGAVILAINGQSVSSPHTINYFPALVGAAGGSVDLRIQQDAGSQPQDIALSYGEVSGCYNWYHELVSEDPRIGYIRTPDFDGNAAHEIFTRIQQMEQDGELDGLIVDVRHNPGGNSDNSVAVFAEGFVGTVGKLREGRQRTIYRIRGPVEWNTTTPLMVLTDGSSHSASEYFAISLRVLERGETAGMPSAGNTEGITGYILSDGSLIRLAISILQLNDGSFIEDIGVVPDIEVPLGQWGLAQQPFDVQLQAAIDALSE
jgi:C-terminal peptidase prc